MEVRYSPGDTFRWWRFSMWTARVQRFMRREGMWQDHRSRVNLRKMLVVGVWKWLCYFCACVCEKRASIICKLSLWKRSGAGGKDVSLSELDMKHRKQPLWSLLSCQSALHRDRMLPLLMWRTDRPETHMQTQINWEKRRRSYESDWCWHSNSSLRRHNHDDQLGGQSSGLLFYIRTPISLTACEHSHFHQWAI